ncbi:MAG: glycosyltransferase family 2 protein [Chloroflexota bacterium]|nr:glycosyltransferase family 2 protein [Dehalococcoidia bacterium]MDW8253963.1 glycosyltransferase family 2 protein [Chloroflexota bacterium]
MTLDLSVVIVNWNVRDLLDACLASLHGRAADDAPNEIIVVDNGSRDGSVAMVKARYPGVRLIEAPHNPGFAGGTNLGASVASGRALFLLNPDTVVEPGALRLLTRALRNDPTLGAVGPQLIASDGSTQSSRRRFPTPATLFVESTPLQGALARRAIRRYYFDDVPPSARAQPDWLVGAAVMIRRSAWDDVGPLDEGYFMYFEETDWFRRAAARGWRAAYIPEARVIHHSGKSSEQNIAARHLRFTASKLRYAERYHGTALARVLGVWLRLLFLEQLAEEAGKWVLGHKRPLRTRRISELSRVVTRRWSREASVSAG